MRILQILVGVRVVRGLVSTHVRIKSPLVEEGIIFKEDLKKPVLLYCPGIDGSSLSVSLQLAKLGERFDVRCLEISGRPKIETVLESAASFLQSVAWRPYFVAGESFGALVALSLAERARGVILVNPATSYFESRLREAYLKEESFIHLFFGSDISGFFFQLLQIFSGQQLPRSIDTPEREAYMGRLAFSLPQKIAALPDTETLRWRLEHWFEIEEARQLWQRYQIPQDALLLIGERDEAIPRPAVENKCITIPKAAHGTTLGPRCDLAAIIDSVFFQGPPIERQGELAPRRHPRVSPFDYESFRVPTNISVCLGPDCKKDGAQDVLRLFESSRVSAIPCRSLCGDGPIVQVNSYDAVRTYTRVRTLDAVNEIRSAYLPNSVEIAPTNQLLAITSRRQGPLDLDRTKRVLVQRIVWLFIVLGVSLLEEDHHQLALFPDRFIVGSLFLLSFTIVPEANRELGMNLRKLVRNLIK